MPTAVLVPGDILLRSSTDYIIGSARMLPVRFPVCFHRSPPARHPFPISHGLAAGKIPSRLEFDLFGYRPLPRPS